MSATATAKQVMDRLQELELRVKALEGPERNRGPEDAEDDVERIVATVAKEFQISSLHVFSKARWQPCVLARHIAMVIMHRRLEYGASRISKFFHCNHATVLYAIAAVADRLGSEPEFRKQFELIDRNLPDLESGT